MHLSATVTATDKATYNGDFLGILNGIGIGFIATNTNPGPWR